eukprot:TRINITY_DN12804_c0_g1_i1.p1 TRINITY_DN12804_c0_g1~~TRINITY_DN12804_c0_g1_i1.p1  ORF type:complete len:487 (+),score=108.98 TRINITY_DN12804_c0_g1_i1:70-1530(+)
MDTTPWHLKKSYLATGWHVGCKKNESRQPVLPNLRRMPAKPPVKRTDEEPLKELRPSLASAAKATGESQHDEAVADHRRLLPAPPCDWRRRRGDFLLKKDEDLRAAVQIDLEDFHRGPEEYAENCFFEDAFTDESRLFEVVSSSPGLLRLCLADHSWFEPELLERLGRMVPKLRELSLRNTRATDAAVAAFGTNCPELRKLDVSECRITDLSCVGMLPDLRELRASGCDKAVNAAVVASLRTARHLELLDLSHCSGVDDEGLIALASEGGVQHITHLDLSSCENLQDDGLVAICLANPTIDYLSVAYNPKHISDDRVSRAVRSLLRVRTLDFGGCPQLGHQLAQSIARYCEFVENICFAMNEVPDGDLYKLLITCPHLRRLDLSNCELITDEGLQGSVPQAKSLRTLILTQVANVSDECVGLLQQRRPDVKIDRAAKKYVDPNNLHLVLGEPWRHKKKSNKAKKKKDPDAPKGKDNKKQDAKKKKR